jgi:hypothetical protein
MKHFFLVALTCSIAVFSAKAQTDTTNDRWKDIGNSTHLNLGLNGTALINATNFGNSHEQPFRIEVNDDPNSYFSVINGTNQAGRFQPVLRGHYGTNYSATGGGAGLYLYSSITPNLDLANSNTTMMSFEVRRSLSNVFTTADRAVQNVDLFRWRNLGDVLMLIDSDGELGVNTSAPTARLHINGSVRFQNLPSGTGTHFLTADANGNVFNEPLSNLDLEDEDWYLSSNGFQTTSFPSSNSDDIFTLGRVGIGGAASLSETPAGTTNPMPITLTVYGNSYASGGQWTSSDRRYKRNVQEIGNSANSILEGLTGYSYHFVEENSLKLPTGLQYGLMAQDIEKVLPEAVTTVTLEGNEIQAVNYQMLFPFLVEGYKQQQAQLTELSEELAQIKEMLAQNALKSADNTPAMHTSKFSVYPNPSRNKVNLDLSGMGELGSKASINIYTVEGKLIKEISVKNGAVVIPVNLTGFAKGHYTVVVSKNGESLASQKFLID